MKRITFSLTMSLIMGLASNALAGRDTFLLRRVPREDVRVVEDYCMGLFTRRD